MHLHRWIQVQLHPLTHRQTSPLEHSLNIHLHTHSVEKNVMFVHVWKAGDSQLTGIYHVSIIRRCLRQPQCQVRSILRRATKSWKWCCPYLGKYWMRWRQRTTSTDFHILYTGTPLTLLYFDNGHLTMPLIQHKASTLLPAGTII